MTFTAEKKFTSADIRLGFPNDKRTTLEVANTEGSVIWSRNLSTSQTAFRFASDSNQFQVGKLSGAGSVFERKIEVSDMKGQLTFYFFGEEAATSSTFIGIADLRDGKMAHTFDLGQAPLEISSVNESGVDYWVLRAPLQGPKTPPGYSYAPLITSL